MASAEHEPITAVWGRAPSGVQGQSPWSGGQSPPEAESILIIGCLTEPANLAPVRENTMFCYGPLVSELGGGGPECMVPPAHVCVCVLPPGFATGNRWHIGVLLVRPVVREIALAPDDFGIWRRGFYPHLGLVAIGAAAA